MIKLKGLTLGSLFDGIGGFPFAAQSLGIRTIWTSEINPTCCDITARHFPDAIQLGDVTKINGAKIPPVDIISFGSPCQDLSVAGRRAGIDGERSGLFMEAVRIIYEMREATNGKSPTYIIWENVPGAYSSHGGDDFRRVLQEIAKTEIPMPKCGKWAESGMVRTDRIGIAWRTFDAQYWGVPQRRKRIYLVANFAAVRTEEILFKPESLLGYKESHGQAGKEARTAVGHCSYSAGFLSRNGAKARSLGYEDEIAPCLRAGMIPDVIAAFNWQNSTTAAGIDYDKETAPTIRACAVPACLTMIPEEMQLFECHSQDSRYNGPLEVCPAVVAKYGTGGGNVPLVVQCKNTGVTQSDFNVAYRIGAYESNSMKSNNPNSGIGKTDVSKTLDGNCCNPSCNQGGICIVAAYAIGNGQANNTKLNKIPRALNCMHDKQSVLCVYTIDRAAFNQGINAKYDFEIGDGKVTSTLVAKGPSAVCIIQTQCGACFQVLVRRLTPIECERLQGFPDDWTKYRANGAEIKDAPRYTALGNSIAVPCAVRVFKGILDVDGKAAAE